MYKLIHYSEDFLAVEYSPPTFGAGIIVPPTVAPHSNAVLGIITERSVGEPAV